MRRPNLLLILLIIIALASCKKSGLRPVKPTDTTKSVTPPVNTATVYVLGADQTNAVYWKNGKETILSKTVAGTTYKSAEAHAMAMYNNDAYIVGLGTRNDGSSAALVWKNGIPDTLAVPAGKTGPVLGSRALSIAVSGSDIYIGGDDYSATTDFPNGAAVLWKNGVPTAYDGFPYSFSTTVVSGGNVYTAGCRESPQFNLPPLYFKNGVLNYYPSNSFGWINDICISDSSDIYIAGSLFLTARYWKNGAIGGPSGGYYPPVIELTGITLLGKDVYYISSDGSLWKNDTLQKTDVKPGDHFAKIVANKKDIYITGYSDTLVNNTQQTIATVWKDQVGAKLSVYGSNAYGIYIQ
jgi:hypothetical protein